MRHFRNLFPGFHRTIHSTYTPYYSNQLFFRRNEEKRHVATVYTNVDKAAKKSRQNLEIVSEEKHNHLYLCWPTTFHNYNSRCGPIL